MSGPHPRPDRGRAPRPATAPARLLEPLIQAAPGASAVAVAAFHEGQHLLATAGTTRRRRRGGPIRPYRTTGGVGAVVRERRSAGPDPAEADEPGTAESGTPEPGTAEPRTPASGSPEPVTSEPAGPRPVDAPDDWGTPECWNTPDDAATRPAGATPNPASPASPEGTGEAGHPGTPGHPTGAEGTATALRPGEGPDGAPGNAAPPGAGAPEDGTLPAGTPQDGSPEDAADPGGTGTRVHSGAGADTGGYDPGDDLTAVLGPVGVTGAGPDGAPETDCPVVCGGTEPEPVHPIDPHTPFETGSVTKTFTALLLAELVARGEVRYDDPVSRYLPAGLAPPSRGAPITLLHLATHTAGLPRLPPGLLRRAAPRWFSNPYAGFHPGDLLAALPRTRPFAAPGTRMRYSNYGVGLLGVLLARATGTDYPTLLRQRVLRPLGLHDTGCQDTADRVTGYWHRRPRPHWRIPALPAAGALRSSPHDLLRYLTALVQPDAWPTPDPLRAALTDVLRPRLALPGTGDRICLVWNVRRRPDHDLYFHSGGTRGCTTFVGFSPQRGVALVALANTSPALHGAFVQRAYLTLRELASKGTGRETHGGRGPTVTVEA